MRITIKDGRDAKAVITSSLDACRGKVRDSSEKAQRVISSLATAGFEIVRLPKPPRDAVFDIVSDALDAACQAGKVPFYSLRFNRNQATDNLLQCLDAVGYQIVHRTVPLTIRTPEGSSVSGRIVTHDEVDEAQPAEALQGLRKALAAARSATFSSRDGLLLGAVVELPKGFAVVGTGIGVDTQPAIEPRAQAIRDCVEASRLQHRAAAVLGYDAVSELMSELPAPEGEAA